MPARRDKYASLTPHQLASRTRGQQLGTSLLCAALLTTCAADSASTLQTEVSTQLDALNDANAYASAPLAPATASADGLLGEAQRFEVGMQVPTAWWELFESLELNQLVASVLDSNTDLQAANATLIRAQENLAARRGSRLPAVALTLGSRREQFSGAMFGQPEFPSTLFSLANASLDAAYDIDLFGRLSSERKGASERAEAEAFRYEAIKLDISASAVAYAIVAASLTAQIEATGELIALETERVQLLTEDLALGGIARLELVASKAKLAQVKAELPGLERDLAFTSNQLAVLAGELPSQRSNNMPAFERLRLPTELPVSLASELVRQRPDVAMSAAMVRAASADVGLASANMLPRLTLTSSYGGLSPESSEVISPESIIWNVAAGLSQPLFSGGRLKADKRAALAGFEVAAAQYRGVVLGAFQDVSNALAALQYDAQALAQWSAAERAAAEHVRLSSAQFDVGAIAYTDLIDAKQQHHIAQLALTQAQALRLSDTVSLFRALGGGWQEPAN